MQRETDKIGLWQTYRNVLNYLSSAQKAFVKYLMNAYIQAGVDELGKDKLKTLLALKFGSVTEGISALGGTPQARQTFKDFQRRLYVG